MRMTNKIMQNNSLYNINNTKINEDKLTTQMTTQSKIDKPSDDPVVAIRALRLRTNVSEAEQYHEKNAPDADQWLDVTAGALTTVTELLTDLYKQAEKGSNKDYTASDLLVIFDQMKAYTKEFYATGNQDYAGRYIFTGYRTDTPLTFKEAGNTPYKITEKIGKDVMDTVSYTDYTKLKDVATLPNAKEQDISNYEISRIRLSYADVMPNLTEEIEDPPGSGNMVPAKPKFSLLDKNGTEVKVDDGSGTVPPTMVSIPVVTGLTREAAYQAAAADTGNTAYFIAETGEILLSASLAETVAETMEDSGTMSVTYEKQNWKTDDLNPQHFFSCEDLKSGIKYNYDPDPEKDGDVNTVINYDVGYNQKIQVNTNASEVFVHDLYRDMDDLNEALQELDEVEKLQKRLKEELEGFVEGEPEYKDAKDRLDAANKTHTYVRERVQSMMEKQITKYQKYLDMTDLAITQNGTRSSRLKMISTRLSDQKTIYRELQEDNEGIDMPEVAVNLTSAKMTYDAALQATSKILQNSLMNYI